MPKMQEQFSAMYRKYGMPKMQVRGTRSFSAMYRKYGMAQTHGAVCADIYGWTVW